MATFTGSIMFLGAYSDSDAEGRVSADLATFDTPATFGTPHVDPMQFPTGDANPYRNSPVVTSRFLGVAQPAFGSDPLGPARDWFERFFVIFDGAAFGQQHLRNLGYLLSNQQMQFEIWNTDRFQTHTLLSLTPAGPSGVEWDDPYGLPLDYRALQSRIYEVQVRLAGAPQIQNWLVVAFDSLAGPDPTVEGLRVTPIPFTPNWAAGFEEGPVFRTDIMRSADDSEQRQRRRFLARHRIRYEVIPENDRELQLLDQLLYGWSKFAFGIPLWSDARRLTADTAIGDTVIPVLTTDRRFIPNGNVLLLSDAFTWEAAHVVTVNPSDLQVEDELQNAWLAHRTWVVPLYFGRLAEEMLLDRPTGELAVMTIDALCDPAGL